MLQSLLQTLLQTFCCRVFAWISSVPFPRVALCCRLSWPLSTDTTRPRPLWTSLRAQVYVTKGSDGVTEVFASVARDLLGESKRRKARIGVPSFGVAGSLGPSVSPRISRTLTKPSGLFVLREVTMDRQVRPEPDAPLRQTHQQSEVQMPADAVARIPFLSRTRMLHLSRISTQASGLG